MIPRTISDAIQLVKDIGQRYLWVDSLCIVQDDDNDKHGQLPIMDNIYSNAELVIIAAAGSDANAGLPGMPSTRRRNWQRVESINGTRLVTAQPPMRQVLDRSIWSSRGWTFQEAILSRRSPVFTENLLYWNCTADTWREDIKSESSVAGLMSTKVNSLWGRDQLLRLCRTANYCELVETFSQRQFKEEGDVIWAFIGILKLQATRFSFIWAHPLERLDATLLWSEASSCIGVHPRHVRHILVRNRIVYSLPYPSWSWLSTNMPVRFTDLCGASIVSEVTWHEPLNLEDEALAAYLKSTHSKPFADEDKDQPSVNLLAKSTSESNFMQYGLLYFTARTTVLTLKREEACSRSPSTLGQWAPVSKTDTSSSLPTRGLSEASIDRAQVVQLPPDRWVKASINSLTGEQIGMLTVSLEFFNNTLERSGELILLSSNARKEADDVCEKLRGEDCGSFKHVNGCKHILSRNIMLIEWEGNIAFRRGLGTVEKEGWDKVETHAKEIILG